MMTTARFDDLAGASVFITGGGSGIGEALTRGFLAQGAKVAFLDLTVTEDSLAATLEATGRPALALQGDITDTTRLRAAMAEAEAAHGPLNVLINNAANDQRHDPLQVDEAFWDWSMAVNLRAYFFACQTAIASMRDQGGGRIINMSSISYMMGLPGYPAYATANGAITAMTRSLAREYGPNNIRINALAPGWVMTEKQISQWAHPEAVAEHMKRQALPQQLQPEDMVGPALFLASQASAMITGQCLPVDGGVVATG